MYDDKQKISQNVLSHTNSKATVSHNLTLWFVNLFLILLGHFSRTARKS